MRFTDRSIMLMVRFIISEAFYQFLPKIISYRYYMIGDCGDCTASMATPYTTLHVACEASGIAGKLWGSSEVAHVMVGALLDLLDYDSEARHFIPGHFHVMMGYISIVVLLHCFPIALLYYLHCCIVALLYC